MSDDGESYDHFAARLTESGIIGDPWIDGQPRFRAEPVILRAAEQRALYRAAEEMAAVYDELCRIVSEKPRLLDDFFALTPCQKAMWFASEPHWHGIARADLFMTAEGPVMAELNCDTPTGEAEAVVLSRLSLEHQRAARDPNAELGERFGALVSMLVRRSAPSASRGVVGLLYPTEFTEDLALVRLYREWLSRIGYGVVLGSPYNLSGDEQGLSLFGERFSLLLRHYKTDWWGERSSVWIDERIADPEPLTEPLSALLEAVADGQAAVLNPLASVLPQNKRSMAFMWEYLQHFSPSAQRSIQRYLPVTSRLEVLHPELLMAEREEWVLKSDYGAEGEEVILGRLCSEEQFRTCLEKARPGRWIAQRYFAALENEQRESINYGVYLVAGQACGLYGRVQAGPTDVMALSAPVLVAE